MFPLKWIDEVWFNLKFKFKWTGVNMKDPKKLMEVASSIIKNSNLQPLIDGTTFCNVAVKMMAMSLGYQGFKGLMANQIIDLMSVSDEWKFIPIEKSWELATAGTWIIASQRGEVHGHVCSLIPGGPVTAGHWGIQVPVCMNVGKVNEIGKGINWYFQDIPKLYAWRSSL